jgi:trehalose 6-phosphate phosphatase
MTASETVDAACRSVIERVAPAPNRAGVFVDFDGTLAAIVDDPERAVVVPGALDTFDRLAARLGLLAVVSGRPGAFLASRLEIAERHSGVRAFGLYGQEEVLASGVVRTTDRSSTERNALEATIVIARRAAPFARIEDKGDTVAFHFRERPGDRTALADAARQAAERFGLDIREGRMVYELVAPGAPDKGDVVRRLVANLDVGVAFGDDVGDIAAFEALDATAEHTGLLAVKIAVGGSETPVGLTDLADFTVSSPDEVAAVLTALADALEKRSEPA